MATAQRSVVQDVGAVTARTLGSIARGRFSWREVLRQTYEFANGGLGIVILCVGCIGVIILLEYSFHVKLVIQNDSLVPSFAMIMLTRELAPSVTALLLVSKMGASIAAELGAMKTTEQLDAYRLLGLDPIDLFVAPRVIASAMSTLVLSIISLTVALAGGWLIAITALGFTTGTFFGGLFTFTRPSDFVLLTAKAIGFGASLPIISATYGFRCKFGAEGVGLTTTDAVVANSIWIIVLDFVFTYVYTLIVG